jgi:hypothetical protein
VEVIVPGREDVGSEVEVIVFSGEVIVPRGEDVLSGVDIVICFCDVVDADDIPECDVSGSEIVVSSKDDVVLGSEAMVQEEMLWFQVVRSLFQVVILLIQDMSLSFQKVVFILLIGMLLFKELLFQEMMMLFQAMM